MLERIGLLADRRQPGVAGAPYVRRCLHADPRVVVWRRVAKKLHAGRCCVSQLRCAQQARGVIEGLPDGSDGTRAEGRARPVVSLIRALGPAPCCHAFPGAQ